MEARIQSVIKRRILINKGVKQGCPCSPHLFGIFFKKSEPFIMKRIEQAIREGRCNKHDFVIWGGKIVCILYFADDVVLIARTEKGMQILMEALRAFCEQKSLTINYSKGKPEVMRVDRPTSKHYQDHQSQSSTELCPGQTINITKEYKYLGVITDGKGTDNLQIN